MKVEEVAKENDELRRVLCTGAQVKGARLVMTKKVAELGTRLPALLKHVTIAKPVTPAHSFGRVIQNKMMYYFKFENVGKEKQLRIMRLDEY